MVFIAANGAPVVHRGVQVSADVLDRSTVARAVHLVRGLAAGGARVGAVVCGTRSAYVESVYPALLPLATWSRTLEALLRTTGWPTDL